MRRCQKCDLTQELLLKCLAHKALIARVKCDIIEGCHYVGLYARVHSFCAF